MLSNLKTEFQGSTNMGIVRVTSSYLPCPKINLSLAVATLSGPGGATLRSFDVVSGELLLEKHLHSPQSGILAEPNHLGTYIAFGNETNGNPDLFVLTNGHTVNHVVAGNVKWTWTSEDQGYICLFDFAITAYLNRLQFPSDLLQPPRYVRINICYRPFQVLRLLHPSRHHVITNYWRSYFYLCHSIQHFQRLNRLYPTEQAF
jgi:hypothetical protein